MGSACPLLTDDTKPVSLQSLVPSRLLGGDGAGWRLIDVPERGTYVRL